MRASSLDHVLEVLAQEGPEAKVLAGGQSLVPLLNLRLAAPAVLVDINPVAELTGLSRRNGRLRLGALTRHRELETSPEIGAAVPLLAAAAHLVGHTAIRTRGTFGGSLAHADPAAELGMAGLALEAEVLLRSRRGERRLPLDAFFQGYYMTALAPEEVLVAVELPVPAPGTGWAVEEFSLRHGDFALAAVACLLRRDASGRVGSARVALAGVGPAPIRARRLEASLVGAEPDAFGDLAAAVDEEIQPEDDIHASADYRRHLARVLTRRALVAAWGRAQPSGEGGA